MTLLVNYKQTATERYDTDVNERAEKAVEALGLKVVGSWGGCGLGAWGGDALPADHGFEIEATIDRAQDIKDALRFIVGSPETITVVEDTDV